MASGRQVAEESLQTFQVWMLGKTDDDYRAMESKGVLHRINMAKECGFGTSTFRQNPRVKKALHDLEEELRLRGVLPPKVEEPAAGDGEDTIRMREPSRLKAAQESERLRRLEQENAALKAEVVELKRTVEKYAALREALVQTGRLPR